MMDEHPKSLRELSWPQRFAVAARGIKFAVCTEATLPVHLCATVVVLITTWVLQCSRIEWCLLILCIGTVLAAELFNTALEHLARAITQEENPHIRNALDIASGAVLVTALTAATLGSIVLGACLFK